MRPVRLVRPVRVSFSRTTAVSITLSALVLLAPTACSSDARPNPGPSSLSTSPSSPAASPGAPKDDSAAVLGWTPPSVVAKTHGEVETVSTGVMVPATAEIISVQAGDASTILTWQLSAAEDVPLQGLSLNSTHGARDFPDAVRLIDTAGRKSYAVSTVIVDNTTYCVCSPYPIHVGPDPVRMTAEYPKLPATATSVSVGIPNFYRVSVPVTR